MIPEEKHDKLVRIYFYICETFPRIQHCCLRYSNNCEPKFTDQEIMTIYLYVKEHVGLLKISQIHQYCDENMRDWFPELGSYQAFNARLNRLSGAFAKLAEILLQENIPQDCISGQNLLDSMPIITCSAKRRAKPTLQITDKGYCSTKSMYYYGVKLHLLGIRRKGSLPFPEQIMITPASINDITILKTYWAGLKNRVFFGDKIYSDFHFNAQIIKENQSEIITPVKIVKGMAEVLKQRDKASDDLFSTAVSRIRQPIESFFNWLIEKTGIQVASKVRSYEGLLVHIYGKITAAFISFAVNP